MIPLSLLRGQSRKIIKLSDIIKVVTVESLDILTEAEYLRILNKDDNISAIRTDNEENEAAEESGVLSLAAFLGTDI